MTKTETALITAITIHLTEASICKAKAKSGNYNMEGYRLYLSARNHKINAETLKAKLEIIH